MLCAEKEARLRVAPVDDSGQVLLDEYEKLLGPKTRLVSITQVSNALGTVVPVKEMVEAAHRHGARVLVDGAQAVSHMRVDMQAINCDFYVFSGHKVFAPTGIGVVYGKSEVLDNMPPWQGGGNMIQDVTFEKTLYQPPPQRFEAGTGNIADAVGLGAAIDYLDRVGIANVARHEHTLLVYATEALQRIPGLHIIGTAKEKAGVLSFVMDGFRTEEIGDYLNRKGIAVRGGHHCAQPILRRFGVESTLRATLALYNTCEEIDALVAALWDLRQGRNPGLHDYMCTWLAAPWPWYVAGPIIGLFVPVLLLVATSSLESQATCGIFTRHCFPARSNTSATTGKVRDSGAWPSSSSCSAISGVRSREGNVTI